MISLTRGKRVCCPNMSLNKQKKEYLLHRFCRLNCRKAFSCSHWSVEHVLGINSDRVSVYIRHTYIPQNLDPHSLQTTIKSASLLLRATFCHGAPDPMPVYCPSTLVVVVFISIFAVLGQNPTFSCCIFVGVKIHTILVLLNTCIIPKFRPFYLPTQQCHGN